MYSKGAWFPIPLCKIVSLKYIWPKMTVNIWKSCMSTAVKKLWDRSDPRSYERYWTSTWSAKSLKANETSAGYKVSENFSPPRLLLWQTAFRLSVYFVKPPFREIGAGWGSMGVRCVLGGVGSLHIFCSFLSFVIFFLPKIFKFILKYWSVCLSRRKKNLWGAQRPFWLSCVLWIRLD